ncbi:MAG TPA: cyclic nucleotide-binding domain-containing protein [Gaiellaceae bacterium]|nr:cyclic nucleotide-binding domain-containing protein [Gaiellaceae bacterium]
MPSPSPTELAAIPLFASLDDAELTELATRFEAKDVDSGVRLVGEGTTGRTFFVLARGEASVTVDGGQIAMLEANEFFGELALLGHGRRTATVTTTTSARVLVLFGADFDELRAAHPELACEIDATTARRLG